MRKVKFRGKGIEDYDKDRWYYGSYYKTDDTTYCCKEDYDRNPNNTKHYILFDEMTDWCLPNRKLRADININTLGQYTGLKDKNGKEIYEKDIVKCLDNKYNFTYYIVFYSGGAFRLAPTYDYGTILKYEENNYRYENSCYRRVSSKFRKHTEEFEVVGDVYEANR